MKRTNKYNACFVDGLGIEVSRHKNFTKKQIKIISEAIRMTGRWLTWQLAETDKRGK